MAVLKRAQQEDYEYWYNRDWSIMTEWAKTMEVFQNISMNDKVCA